MLEVERYTIGIGECGGAQPEAHLHRLDEVEAVTDENAQIWHELEIAVERSVDVGCKLLEHLAELACRIFGIVFMAA